MAHCAAFARWACADQALLLSISLKIRYSLLL